MGKKSTSSWKLIALVLSALSAVFMLVYTWLIRKVALTVIQPSTNEVPDGYILDIDYETETITFSAGESFGINGEYGVVFGAKRGGYLKIGNIIRQDRKTITRELGEIVRGTPESGEPAWQMSWFYSGPADLNLRYREILIKGPIGILPSWVFPVEKSSQWAVLVHGRGASRAECLRAVPLLVEQGYNCVVISYRNDGVATPSPSGRYSLGSTEWHDLEAVIEYVQGEGAEDLLIMAWSMGAAITQEYLRHMRGSEQLGQLSGVIYDSPVVDWSTVLDYHADIAGLYQPVRDGARALLENEWGTMLTGAEQALDFDEMSLLEHPENIFVPTLILHSDDDHFVPSSGSRELQAMQSELVTLVSFDEAQHVRLWNYDPARWSGAITSWLLQLRG
ncbi:MAG: alpha/beta hydrolase [Microbacteriaceae bacterium]